MDFNQLLLEYDLKAQETAPGEQWWKTAKWNKAGKAKDGKTVEKDFSKKDFILTVSETWEGTFKWMVQNHMLHSKHDCDVCKKPMELGPYGVGIKND